MSTPSLKVIGLPVAARSLPIPERPGVDEVCARLARDLPRSLELADVLQTYTDEVRHLVDFDALAFSREDEVTAFATAPQARFRAQYRIEIGGNNLGDITFSRARAFDEKELLALETTLAHIGYPLRNALLYREALYAARVDALTGVGNRAALNQALGAEVALADRHNADLAVIILDVDHFKRINDSLGHAAGDDVLRAIARRLRELTRRGDAVFRFGGEEFVVILRNTPKEGAAFIAERLRRHIECAPVRCSGQSVPVTISLGMAHHQAGESASDMLERADRALYRAKQNGRNRVCTAE